MQIPRSILKKMQAGTVEVPRLRWWQMSLRSLFILTAICCLLALFVQPLWSWAQNLWEIWFPRHDPIGCGPCGMG